MIICFNLHERKVLDVYQGFNLRLSGMREQFKKIQLALDQGFEKRPLCVGPKF